MTEEEMQQQQDDEGHAAVLQIVSRDDENHCIEDEHDGTVSYVTLSEGDIIIEI